MICSIGPNYVFVTFIDLDYDCNFIKLRCELNLYL